MNVFEKLVDLLAEYMEIDPQTITMDTTFKSLNLDSLDIAEMVLNVEDELNITLELDESMTTVKDIVRAIEAAL